MDEHIKNLKESLDKFLEIRSGIAENYNHALSLAEQAAERIAELDETILSIREEIIELEEK